jgi:hypothetical protein
MKLKGTMNHLKNDLIFFSNPQTKSNKPSQIEKEKKNFKQLHVERKIWRPHNQNLLCWSFYYICDNEKVDNQAPQLMRCHICYPNLIIVVNSRFFFRKGIISYFKTYGRINF